MSGKIGKTLIALLLVGCLGFILSCAEPAEQLFTGKGMGTFTLQIGTESSGRTIMPDVGATFPFYKLDFKAQVGLGTDTEEDIDGTDIGDPIVTLAAGTYNLTVYGYTTATNRTNGVHAASGELNGIVIAAGASVKGSVTLAIPVKDGSVDGIFSWNITVTAADVDVTMQIVNVDGSSYDETYEFVADDDADPANNKVKYADNIEIPSGYYDVIFTLSKTGGYQDVIWREVLHVADTLTSAMPPKTFDEDYFRMGIFTVTYHRNYEFANPVSYTISYFVDDFETTQGLEDNVLEIYRNVAFDFLGWFEEDGLATAGDWSTYDKDNQTTQWGNAVISPNPTAGSNLIVYAKWEATLLQAAELDFRVEDESNPGDFLTISSVKFETDIEELDTVDPITVKLWNHGGAAATIVSIAFDPATTAFTLNNVSAITSIDDDDSADIIITLAATTAGTHNATLKVVYDNNQEISLAVEADITEAAVLEFRIGANQEDDYNFGSHEEGDLPTAVQTVHVHKIAGTSDVEGVKISIDPTNFFTLGGDLITADSGAADVANGGTGYTLTGNDISFTIVPVSTLTHAGVTDGLYTATITVEWLGADAPNLSEIMFTVSITVDEVVTSADLVVLDGEDAAWTGDVDFEEVEVSDLGTTDPIIVRIKNNGLATSDTVTIEKDDTNFTYTFTQGTIIAGGHLDVIIIPNTGLAVGVHTDSLVIKEGTTILSTIDVKIEVVADTPKLELSGTGVTGSAGVYSYDFGAGITDSADAVVTVTITNNGNAAASITSIGLTGVNVADFTMDDKDDIKNQGIAVGASGDIEIQANSSLLTGSYVVALTVVYDGGATIVLNLTLEVE